MLKKIAWEKWRDDENYIETVQDLEDQMLSDASEEIQNMEQDDEDADEDENDEFVGPNIDVTIYPHVVRTPIGEFSVLDHNLPSKNFDCWIGHFSFPITEEVMSILDYDVDGIEVLRVLSKYRIFIGIAKLFEFRDVRSQINKLLIDS